MEAFKNYSVNILPCHQFVFLIPCQYLKTTQLIFYDGNTTVSNLEGVFKNYSVNILPSFKSTTPTYSIYLKTTQLIFY